MKMKDYLKNDLDVLALLFLCLAFQAAALLVKCAARICTIIDKAVRIAVKYAIRIWNEAARLGTAFVEYINRKESEVVPEMLEVVHAKAGQLLGSSRICFSNSLEAAKCPKIQAFRIRFNAVCQRVDCLYLRPFRSRLLAFRQNVTDRGWDWWEAAKSNWIYPAYYVCKRNLGSFKGKCARAIKPVVCKENWKKLFTNLYRQSVMLKLRLHKQFHRMEDNYEAE